MRFGFVRRLFWLLLLLGLPLATLAQFTYTTSNNQITITGYTGPGGAVTIPSTIDGLPVTRIGDSAFYNRTSLTSVTIPNSVTTIGNYAFQACTRLISVTIPNSVTTIGHTAFYSCTSLASVTIPNSVTTIGDFMFSFCSSLTSITIPNSVIGIGSWAFAGCTSLTGVYFDGNLPSGDSSVLDNANKAIVYYLPGTTGWSSTFAGRPAVLWNPQALTTDPNFGIRAGQFGFITTGTADITVVVESTPDIANPIWTAISTNVLSGGASPFIDSQPAGQAARFYRFRSP